MKTLRLIPAIETWPRVVAFAQKPLGKLAVVALFAGLVWLNSLPGLIELTTLAVALTFLPRWRRHLILAGTAYWFFAYPTARLDRVTMVAWRLDTSRFTDWRGFQPLLILGVVAFFYLYLRLARATRLRLAPLIALYLALVIFAALGKLPPLALTLLWAFLFLWGKWFWYYAYTIHELRTPTPLWLQLGRYTPYWIGSMVPIPKGEGYLQKIEAKTDEELAVTQLKGLKLLLWAAALKLLYAIIYYFSYTELEIPPLSYLLEKHRAHNDYALWRAWAGLSLHYVLKILRLAIRTHAAIAIVRVSGFRALRNTYKPFLSTSIIDFWNRLYYYFKELLVEFFLYPTYLKLSRVKDTRLRMFIATLAAAGGGNILYHLMGDTEEVQRVGFWRALQSFHVYVVYCVILAFGIALSQLARKRGPQRALPWWRAALQIGGVTLFFGIISVLDVADSDMVVDRSLTITDYASFVASLFGV